MKKQLIWITALLTLSLPALADFETVSRAYEVALGKLRFPSSEYSAVSFRECDACEMHIIRLSSNTRFIVNGRPVKYARFQELAARVEDPDSVPVTVLHHLETDTIVRVSVTLK